MEKNEKMMTRMMVKIKRTAVRLSRSCSILVARIKRKLVYKMIKTIPNLDESIYDNDNAQKCVKL